MKKSSARLKSRARSNPRSANAVVVMTKRRPSAPPDRRPAIEQPDGNGAAKSSDQPASPTLPSGLKPQELRIELAARLEALLANDPIARAEKHLGVRVIDHFLNMRPKEGQHIEEILCYARKLYPQLEAYLVKSAYFARRIHGAADATNTPKSVPGAKPCAFCFRSVMHADPDKVEVNGVRWHGSHIKEIRAKVLKLFLEPEIAGQSPLKIHQSIFSLQIGARGLV